VQKFWKNREDLFAKFAKDISSKIAKRKITGINPAHIFLNMISMCLFPFIAKPVWIMSSGMKQEEFIRFMEERKKIVPGFIIQSLKQ
jgi:TetR/AcrR family transcriptional regulator